MKHDHIVFETKRLTLRPTSLDDASFIFELVNTPKWLHNIGDRKVYSTDAAKAYIQEKMLGQLERLGFGNYTVIRKADNVKMGTCGLYDREGLEEVDIGFAFLPEFEGQGYAFEAANKIKDAAFEEFKLTAISAITTKDNNSSQRLLDKLGFSPAGTKVLPGDDEELLLYKLHQS